MAVFSAPSLGYNMNPGHSKLHDYFIVITIFISSSRRGSCSILITIIIKKKKSRTLLHSHHRCETILQQMVGRSVASGNLD